MGFVNIKIKEEFAADLINSLYDDLEEAAKEIVEKNAEIERLKAKLENDSPTVRVAEKNIELLANNELLIEELKEKDLMIEKLGKYHLELEQKHADEIRNISTGVKVISDGKFEAERDKLVKLVTQLQEENAKLKMVMKMAGEKPGRGRPKKA